MFHSGRVIRSVGKGYVSCTGLMATQRCLANTMGRQNARSIFVCAPNKRILADAFKRIAALQRDRACGSISCYLPSSPVLTFSSNSALCWTEDWKKSPPIPSPVPRNFLTRKAIHRLVNPAFIKNSHSPLHHEIMTAADNPSWRASERMQIVIEQPAIRGQATRIFSHW